MDEKNKADVAREVVEQLAPKSRVASNLQEAARVGMVDFTKGKRAQLEEIARGEGAPPEKLDELIKRTSLARLRLRFAGELAKPSDAKACLNDLISAARKMKEASREFSGAMRALGNLGDKVAGRPGGAHVLDATLSDLRDLCDAMEVEAERLASPMAGRQTEKPLDYVVLDAIADAWEGASLEVRYDGRTPSGFQRFTRAAVAPHKIGTSIERAVWEARTEKPPRVRREPKK